MIRRLLALAVLLVLAVGVFPARPAAAHASLVSSVPAPNAVLDSGPAFVVLEFDEPVDVSTAAIDLYDLRAEPVDIGSPVAGDTSTLVQSAVPVLEQGTYAVVWRVTSQDGHAVEGSFAFQVGTGGTIADRDDLLDEIAGGVSSPPVVGKLYGVARALSLGGFIVLCGAVYVLARPVLRRSLRLLQIAWLVLGVGTAAAFALYAARIVGGDLGDAVSPDSWRNAADTHTGTVLLARLGLAGVIGLLLGAVERASSEWWRIAAFFAALATLLTFPLSGHPYAGETAAMWVAIDALHLAAVALWLGGLAVFALGGREWLNDDDRAPVVRAFSRIATVAVVVIVATGVVSTLHLVDDLGSLTDTSWGRTLLVKLVLVVLLVVIAGMSRWLLRHDGPRAVRRTVMTEAVLGAAVVGLAAALVGFPPSPPVPAAPFDAQLSTAGVTAEVGLTPGRVGANEVHLVIVPPGGSLEPVASVTARMTLPDAGLPPAPVTLTSTGTNHYIGAITLPQAGTWTLEIVVQPVPSQTVLLTTSVTIQ